MVSGGKSAGARASAGEARPPQAGGERVRAWVLVKSDTPEQAGSALGDRFGDGLDAYIIIRADEVQGDAGTFAQDVNLIVPVDVASIEVLEQVLTIIDGAPGVTQRTVARVIKYHPSPPHYSHLFVTAKERSDGPPGEFPDGPGRHPKSPGRNGWG